MHSNYSNYDYSTNPYYSAFQSTHSNNRPFQEIVQQNLFHSSLQTSTPSPHQFVPISSTPSLLVDSQPITQATSRIPLFRPVPVNPHSTVTTQQTNPLLPHQKWIMEQATVQHQPTTSLPPQTFYASISASLSIDFVLDWKTSIQNKLEIVANCLGQPAIKNLSIEQLEKPQDQLENLSILQQSRLHCEKQGKFFMEKKDWEQAVFWFKLLIVLNPANRNAWFLHAKSQYELASIKSSNESYNVAIFSCQKANELSHHSQKKEIAEVYLLLGDIYDQKQDKKLAVECYEQALFLNQNLSPAYRKLGFLYSQLKNADKAIEALQTYLYTYLADEEAHFKIATLYESKGNITKASNHYAKVTSKTQFYTKALEGLMRTAAASMKNR